MTRVQPWTCAQCGEQIEGYLIKCWNCGVRKDGSSPDSQAEFTFAKKTLTVPPAPLSEPASTPPTADHKHAFDLLYESDELEDLLRYTPPGARSTVWNTFWISLGLLLVTLAIIGRLDSLVTAVLIVLGAYPLIIGLYGLLKSGWSPLERLPSIVVSKPEQAHPETTDTDTDASPLSVHIETWNGHRQQCCVSLPLYLKIEQDDVGVSYIRGNQMLDFKKVTLRKT